MNIETTPSAAVSVLRGATGAPRRRMLGVGIWGLSDQALISATNFATMVLLARALGPASFGSFVLVYTVLLFATELQGALVTQAHNVLGVGRAGSSYAGYTRSTAISQMLLAGSLGALAALAGLGAHLAGWGTAPLLLLLAPAIVA